ncbi:MAG: TrkH family potassium uptake protein [Paracoccaceae bacterium]
MRPTTLTRMARARMVVFRVPPARLLLLGYLAYMSVGWLLLCLPPLQQVPVSAIDALFIAVSAVSTTGLVTVDPGGSFTFGGEVVILLLIQAGGLGYMTIGSFATLAITHKLSGMQVRTARAAFSLPEGIDPTSFVKAVVLFTLLVEAIGAAVLFLAFSAAGVEDPLWPAIFHAVSAFCTAGFSLFATSLEAFRGDVLVNVTIATLSLLGAMGFLIVVDMWRTMTGQARHLGFTSKVIFRITLSFLLLGTGLLMVVEPTIAGLPPSERLMAAFFQVMTASTTVGFNTVPIGAMGASAIVLLLFLMVVGASPAGTGGGLKTTSFAAILGLLVSTLKGREQVRFVKRRVPLARLQTATASLAFYVLLLLGALFVLGLTEPEGAMGLLVFEAISAMGTVGLSMGATGGLSDLGKLVIVVLMTAGRVGILTFGIALASHDESREEEEDNELVM